ncbi:right oriC-binding transcriptional activator [Pragia fontium]|uniref:Right oriC-binding transcriptional activator n=1 Tax=Pragia fontium TaxID=82985 RepID=A0ABQ5LK03_9GAMM|nr:MDR efflux pump AcrAB transcriptional activator RobA [Pragia fontium]AKJ41320.1 transcriptional regulator [Pragia fontium]GKX62873.1 right oriC-binding transcriptional activator [Pragia fontium]
MDQASIIHDLLHWLESHLDQPLSLDNVAAKSGYSKWHLQRMFKDITGQAIGSYIRARRLSKAAVALRLTARPILDVALQYRFDSQQTFTRAFKKQFAQTPAFYRRSDSWSAIGMCPPIKLSDNNLIPVEYVMQEEKQLIGVTQSYTCRLEDIFQSKTQIRTQFWKQYLGTMPVDIPPILYGLNHSRPSQEKDDEQEVFYTTALEPQHVPQGVEGHPITLQSGEYALFRYNGPPEDLQHFVMTLYGTCLPLLKLTRRKGYDIEIFHPKQGKVGDATPAVISGEYMIPIQR